MTLIGPKPEYDIPVFPTPWTTNGSGRILDSAGNSILYLESYLGSNTEDGALADLIVSLVNNHAEANKQGEAYSYFIQTFSQDLRPEINRKLLIEAILAWQQAADAGMSQAQA